ncbi:MAG: 30S ribosomal protein S20, partial [Alphaproteobacteria bacterium]|nr:30S ribosomal protein S20 [Alphaproteobacteria bacterium]
RWAPVNKGRVSQYRTYVKKVETAIASGDAAAARDALREAQPVLMSGVNKGVAHRNTVARKISRLSRQVKAIG